MKNTIHGKEPRGKFMIVIIRNDMFRNVKPDSAITYSPKEFAEAPKKVLPFDPISTVYLQFVDKFVGPGKIF